MDAALHRARLDWLAEITGAAAMMLAVGFAGLQLAPVLGLGQPIVLLAGGIAGAIAGIVMRAVPPAPRRHALPSFALAPLEVDPLLLDCALDEPLLLTDVLEDDVLILDDSLARPDAGSRVVQLFATPRLPTPGQLKDRIDRHLASGTMHAVREFDGPASDASDALYAALNDLRRSLR